MCSYCPSAMFLLVTALCLTPSDSARAGNLDSTISNNSSGILLAGEVLLDRFELIAKVDEDSKVDDWPNPEFFKNDELEKQRQAGKRGSFGESWFAKDKPSNIDVVVKFFHTGDLFIKKVLTKDAMRDPEKREMIEREAETCDDAEKVARTANPSCPGCGHRITRCKSAINDEIPHLVMEKAGDQNVEEYFMGQGWVSMWGCRRRPPVQDAIRWTKELLQGLSMFAAAGKVHKDIKPANLMLTSHEKKHIKYIDFGLMVKQGEESQSGTMVTMGPEIFGHLANLRSPGVLFEGVTDEATGATDVYSLGATLFWMLCNGNWFYEKVVPHWTFNVNFAEIYEALTQKGRVPSDVCDAKCKPGFEDLFKIVDKMMSPLAERPTADQLLLDPLFQTERAGSRVDDLQNNSQVTVPWNNSSWTVRKFHKIKDESVERSPEVPIHYVDYQPRFQRHYDVHHDRSNSDDIILAMLPYGAVLFILVAPCFCIAWARQRNAWDATSAS